MPYPSATTYPSSTTYPGLGVLPEYVTRPVITGTTTSGSVLTATSGTWTMSPSSYTYYWESTTDGVTWSPLAVGPENTYLLVDGDIGSFIRVTVVATNGSGDSQPSLSGLSQPITAASTPPPPSGGAVEMKKIGTGAWQAVSADVVVAGAVERQWIPGQGWRTVAADQSQGTGAVERQKLPSQPWLNVPADEGV